MRGQKSAAWAALCMACSFAQLAASATTTTSASACPTVLRPSGYSDPVVGRGWVAQLVVSGLKSPRGAILDSSGALLVVQSGTGIQRITFDDHGGTCLVVKSSQTLVSNSALNHGIELSADGKTLYASSAADVLAYSYDPAAGTIGSGQPQTLVTNMSNADHSTRTLLLSRASPQGTTMLLVSRGSAENMDLATQAIGSGRSQIKAFDIGGSVPASQLPYDYTTGGTLVGWGLRNSVGVAEEPTTLGLYSVENSADDIQRLGTDVHEDNPGEELNFHGLLNETSSNKRLGANYGYPSCFAVWGTAGSDLPSPGSLTVGSQFALSPNATLNDTTCNSDAFLAPRLTFQAHTAPLDLKFKADGSAAYVTFHGSWDRTDPAGYKLSAIPFAKGEPVAVADSTNGTVDILSNPDLSACPGKCFRPVGLALDDGTGRLFMTSDATGEVYVLQQSDVSAQGGGGGGGGATATGSGGGTLVTATGTANLAGPSAWSRAAQESLWVVYAVLALSFVGGAVAVLS